jgi:hypothetical protein
MCTKPTATVECDGSASSDVQALITTLQNNLPTLVQVIQTQGPVAVSAGSNVVTTGGAFVQTIADVGGKALVCAGTALEAAVKAQTSLMVTVQVSVSVSASCNGPTS